MRIVMMMLALVALGVAAVPAGAGEIARFETSLLATSGDQPVEPGTLAAGPVVAGGRVVWAQAGPDQSFVIRSAVAAGVAPETLATLPLPRPRGFDGDTHLIELLGAPDRLAWFEGVESVEDARYGEGSPVVNRFTAGPPGGPFTTVAGCDAPGSCRAPSCFGTGYSDPVVWSALPTGDALLVGTTCDGGPPGLTRVGLGDGGATGASAVALPDGVPLAAAGDLVAVRGPGLALTLRRAIDGAIVAALPPLTAGQTGRGAALQADGTLVFRRFAHGPKGPEPLEVRRPGDARVRRLDAGATLDHVEVGGGRVVFARRPAAGARELAVAGLAGGRTAALLRLAPGDRVHPRPVLRGFARSGDQVAWIVTRCEQVLVGTARLGDAPVDVRPEVCAHPRIVSAGPLHLRRDGRVSIRMTCARACSGLVRRWTATGRQVTLGRFALSGSTTARRVLVRVPEPTRRLIERQGKAYLGLRLSTDPSWDVHIFTVRR